MGGEQNSITVLTAHSEARAFWQLQLRGQNWRTEQHQRGAAALIMFSFVKRHVFVRCRLHGGRGAVRRTPAAPLQLLLCLCRRCWLVWLTFVSVRLELQREIA